MDNVSIFSSTTQVNTLKLKGMEFVESNQHESLTLEELQLGGIDSDVVMISSTNNASESQKTEKVPYDEEAVAETKADIDADMDILKGYDDQYNTLLSQQSDLEKQCADFNYGDLEAIKSSSQASKLLANVKEQISRIQNLIKITENAIKVLEEQKKVAESQLEKRENEQAQLQEEMENLHKQIEQNEKTAKNEAEAYEQGATKWIERYIQEFQRSNLQSAGVDINEWVTQKMQVNYKLPPHIQALYDENDTLIGELNTKGEQLKLVSGAIDTLTAKIENIDKNLEVQNNKLSDYNKNLDVAEKYKDGVIKTRDAWEKVERARRKKKKRGLGGLINRLVRSATKLVKSVVKGVKKLVKGITGAVSGTLKFAGKAVGDVLKPVGMEGLVEGVGNSLAAATDFVSATATFDKDEMKQSLKDLENGAEMAVESKVFKQIEKAGKKVGEAACDTYNDVTQAAFRLTGNIADEALGAVGGIVDKYMGLDSLGNGIEAVGEFVEGTSDMTGGALTGDKSMMKEGWENTKDNVLSAGITVAKVVAAIYTGGTGNVIINLLAQEALGETAKSVGEDIGGMEGQILANIAKVAITRGYGAAISDGAVDMGELAANIGRDALKEIVVESAAYTIAKETDNPLWGEAIRFAAGWVYGQATEGDKCDAEVAENGLTDAQIKEALGLTADAKGGDVDVAVKLVRTLGVKEPHQYGLLETRPFEGFSGEIYTESALKIVGNFLSPSDNADIDLLIKEGLNLRA